MKITNVRVRVVEKENSKMRGFASVTLDDMFAVHDIRILEGDNGLFLAMPSKQIGEGEYKDIAHPINQEARQMFSDAIIEEYKKELAKAEEE
ncbi:MAG: septation regulator SpoVG [Bacilli bacterium]|jgi:stage V sporulation protein G|nr:septation regulator SpoVG [Bacilli bacterium]MCR5482962.1 septation regulator SpoVG [Bacilli bacterium]